MKKWSVAATSAGLALIVALGVGVIRDRRVDGDFPAIRAKSSEMQVKQLMGEPRKVDRPCRAYSVQLITNCDHVFVYRSSLAPVRDKYWLVFFDQNNQATATSTETEP
jgi:hypothetical protein